MAEGFAHKYGADVLHAWSAGVAPAPIVQPLTMQVMSQKNVDIQDQFPKSMHELELESFDVIVNMSGQSMPVGLRAQCLVWSVSDPMAQAEEVYLRVRDQIEGLVMQLILELRRGVKLARAAPTAIAPARTKAKIAPIAVAPAPVKNSAKPGDSSQRFGFGRVRKARD